MRAPLFSLKASVAILTATLLTLTPLAYADALQDIGKLMKQGQPAQALDRAEQYLASNPKDPQARFLKGLVLTELNRQQEAITVFTKLTEDFPESPEPYNNLAVIYAQQKQYDKARQALEMAIRTHPSYATAHENLGDIYAQMASQAYDKALSIDSSNTSAQTKLAMIRDMMTGTGSSSTNGSKRPTSKPVAPPPTVAAAPVAPPPPVVAPPPASKPSTTTPTPPERQLAAAGEEDDDVRKAVKNWAIAWAEKDMRNYLASYAKDFEVPKGQSRSSWEAERHSRIVKPGSIQVEIEGLSVTMEGPDRATARFRQHYRSASLKNTTSKILSMVKRNGVWQIKQERVGR